MTTTRKWILWILGLVLAAFLAVAGFAVWFMNAVPGMLNDLYGQWVAAELVIKFDEQQGRLPANWQELAPVYGDGRGFHHEGLDFAKVRECMVIEFARLGELKTLAQSATNAASIPRVIFPKDGTRSHWQGAEPNQMVYEYLVNARHAGSKSSRSQ